MTAMAFAQYGSGAAVTALLHPFGYAKVLMQIGHEPLDTEICSAFITRKQFVVYPNILKYMGHINKTDGFMGLYRGVFPRVIAGTVGNLVQTNIAEIVKDEDDGRQPENDDEDVAEWLKHFVKTTSKDTLARCCGVICSHPFHVIMIRSMVQFVGKETQYNTLISSVREIWVHDGISGFFSGLIPRLIGEVLTIWVTSFLAQALNKWMLQENKEMTDYTNAACGLAVSSFTYPFTLVANIMAMNNSGLRAGQPPLMPVYNGWYDCYNHLGQLGDLKRGSASFRRAVLTAGSAALTRY